MEQDKPPQERVEVIDEAECARRLLVRRETLSRWRRDAGLPYVPLSDGRRAHVRYVWPDVVAWLRGRSRNAPAPAPATATATATAPTRRRGRPRNVDRAGSGRDGEGRS